ncbi:Dienelactone hydrolase [Aphelenchoides avenae]|nr:Dienelactone hydrolase [Aphelenchus avenae]
MAITANAVDYEIGDDVFEGYLAHPSSTTGTRRPAVVIVHAMWGCGAHEEHSAKDLAKVCLAYVSESLNSSFQLGFVGFAVDLYGKGKRGKTMEESRAFLQPLRDDREGLMRRRLLAAIDHVKSFEFVDKNKIAIIGYCLGGMCALDVARLNVDGVKAAVSFHGTYTPPSDHEQADKQRPIKASVLVCHGDADSHITSEQYLKLFEEMRIRKADWLFVNYADAPHGFTEKSLKDSKIPGVGYNEKAANRSWQAMLDLFAEVFGIPAKSH